MHIKSLLMTGTIAGIALAGPAFAAKKPADAPVAAQTAAEVDALQAQINAMQAQVAYMKRQLEIMTEKNPPNAKPQPKITQSGSNKFALESELGLTYAKFSSSRNRAHDSVFYRLGRRPSRLPLPLRLTRLWCVIR